MVSRSKKGKNYTRFLSNVNRVRWNIVQMRKCNKNLRGVHETFVTLPTGPCFPRFHFSLAYLHSAKLKP